MVDLYGAAQAGRIPRPAPARLPWKPKIAVTARVTPTCVHPGHLMHLVVTTHPVAAIAYQAVYSDNRGGGPAPYGAGYGGNGKGIADASGHFTSSWVISSSAPAGVARVDVVVAIQGNRWGYKSLTFDVGPDAACT